MRGWGGGGGGSSSWKGEGQDGESNLGGFVRVIGVMYGGGGGLVEGVEEMFACVTCPQISDFCKSSY